MSAGPQPSPLSPPAVSQSMGDSTSASADVVERVLGRVGRSIKLNDGVAVALVLAAGVVGYLLVLAVFSFGLVAFAQATFPLWAYHPAAAGLRVHLANGFYANALFDRMVGNWAVRRPS